MADVSQGFLKVNDVLELPQLRVQKKVLPLATAHCLQVPASPALEAPKAHPMAAPSRP